MQDKASTISLNDASLYSNRELSWLQFNSRVLSESQKPHLPLLERLKFIAIYATNLDEFYMIRVAGLKQLFVAGVTVTGADKKTPLEQLRAIRSYLSEEKERLEKSYHDVVGKLVQEGLLIQDYEALSDTLKTQADAFFFSHILPVIVPIAVDSTRPFPHLNNLGIGLAVKLTDTDAPEVIKYGMIRIPRILPGFFHVSKGVYVPTESIVRHHIETIFPGYDLVASVPFRVTRNADLIIEEEEADDFTMILAQSLKLRRKGEFVRLQLQGTTDPDIIEFLNAHLHIFHKDIYQYDLPLNLSSLLEIVHHKDFSHLVVPPNAPKNIPPFNNKSESVFDIISRNDSILFHPYESFDPIVRMIQEAAKDSNVISIRMTLYRVEKHSHIIQTLINAAEAGKQVTVIMELKARFDEENNLHWAKSLEEAGAHVIYGISGFKVHAKITQIIRKEGGKLKFYIHLGTGNYNTLTSQFYTDISYLTCGEEYGKDATEFFHILTGFSKSRKLKTLSMSPMQIKHRLMSMINQEAKAGKEGHIIAKMNALVDPDMIRTLYTASSKGVKIQLIVRGICCLKPGIKGVSENIEVKSIVGKYLEHARIFYFKHATPSTYIASADWMPRNLERRLELMGPILDTSLSNKVYELLQIQLSDTALSWELDAKGEYTKTSPKGQKSINSHTLLENYINRIYKAIKKNTNTAKAGQLIRKLFKET